MSNGNNDGFLCSRHLSMVRSTTFPPRSLCWVEISPQTNHNYRLLKIYIIQVEAEKNWEDEISPILSVAGYFIGSSGFRFVCQSVIREFTAVLYETVRLNLRIDRSSSYFFFSFILMGTVWGGSGGDKSETFSSSSSSSISVCYCVDCCVCNSFQVIRDLWLRIRQGLKAIFRIQRESQWQHYNLFQIFEFIWIASFWFIALESAGTSAQEKKYTHKRNHILYTFCDTRAEITPGKVG